ncbi:MAG TPA: FlgD immunoglobulin-like domain containing protein [Capsulimonadaceae bacterium]
MSNPLAHAEPSPVSSSGSEIHYQLPRDSFVTIVVEDPNGKRIRNLVSCAGRHAGENVEAWDGRDDAGRPVPAGQYRWRGLTHDEIASFYRSSFYSPGNPPWLTVGKPQWNMRVGSAGGWLSDHAAPKTVFADDKMVYLAAPMAEAGHSLIEVTPDGHKQWGSLWFTTSCADAVATDGGIIYIAGEKGWTKDKFMIHRVDQTTHQFVPNPKAIKALRNDPPFVFGLTSEYEGIRGMVITPKYIVVSLADHDRLALFDRETAAFVRDVPLASAGYLAKAGDGSIYAISGAIIVRVDLDNGKHVPVITHDLVKPVAFAIDKNGDFYVTDATPSEQRVVVLTATGKVLRRIGKAGGRREGAFDPLAMANPAGIAIDAKGQIWVAENDFLPKRVSVWTRDGKLVMDFTGPCGYGGGGSLDPADSRRAFYSGMELTLSKEGTRSTVKSVLYRPEEHPDMPFPLTNHDNHHSMAKAVRRDGVLYLVADSGYSGGVAGGSEAIGEVVGDHLAPRAILGTVKQLRAAWATTHAADLARLCPASVPDSGLFLWSDANGNGKMEPAEVTIRGDLNVAAEWSVQVGADLALHAVGKDTLVTIAPKAGKRLAYDFADAVTTPMPKIARERGLVAVSSDLAGNYILNVSGDQGDPSNVIMGVAKDGRELWTYPNPYPTNTHNSPRSKVGDIQHTLNIEGVARVGGDAGDIFQLNGNKGVRYLFTTDGLFVGQLYGDMRSADVQQSLQSTIDPATGQGVRLDKMSLCDECFFGWIGTTTDGRVLQIVGKDSNNVAEVTGLSSIKRLSGGSLTLAHEASAVASGPSAVGPVRVILSPPFSWWYKVNPYSIPVADPIATFVVSANNYGLSLHVEAKNGSKFVNAGDDLTTLFKTGDAVDLRFAADPSLPADRTKPMVGDSRIVFAMYHGKPVAVRYRFVVPGTANPSQFASPTGTTVVDEVKLLDKAGVTVDRDASGYTLKAELSWADLGLKAMPSGAYKGDLGVIVADSSGTKAIARYYHFDRESGVVVDLSSEARVSPARWGMFEF